jgi:integrase
MPKLLNRVPSYRFHKQSGQAMVTLNGHDICLGRFGTPESRREYDRAITEWIASGRQFLPDKNKVTISEIIAAYWMHADGYYRRGDGTLSDEVSCIKKALSPLRQLYGPSPAAQFGPLALKAVREKMIQMKWCRTYTNNQIGRVRRMFKWATENELIPPDIYHGLIAVAGLKAGRCAARESIPVRPVPDDHVNAVLLLVSRQVAAMIRLQLLTGMRPGEVCIMRGIDFDTTGELWQYRPHIHKTAHHGHQRIVYLGPKAQEIVKPFLKTDLEQYLFSPAEAEVELLGRRGGRR